MRKTETEREGDLVMGDVEDDVVYLAGRKRGTCLWRKCGVNGARDMPSDKIHFHNVQMLQIPGSTSLN